jgi:hypothetical protein
MSGERQRASDAAFQTGAEVARKRAWGSCEVCGKRRDVMTHHRQPRQMGGVSGVGLAVNRPSALLRVCQFCNDQLEVQQRGLAYDLGLIVRRPTVPAEVPVWLNTINGPGWWLLDDEGSYKWVDLPVPAEVLAVARVGRGR